MHEGLCKIRHLFLWLDSADCRVICTVFIWCAWSCCCCCWCWVSLLTSSCLSDNTTVFIKIIPNNETLYNINNNKIYCSCWEIARGFTSAILNGQAHMVQQSTLNLILLVNETLNPSLNLTQTLGKVNSELTPAEVHKHQRKTTVKNR